MTQQSLIDGVSTNDREAFEPPSILVTGVHFDLNVKGRQVTGELNIDKPNPRARRTAKVNYTAPASWSSEHHGAALRIVAHWFRDIGGFANVAKRHLCHVVQRLMEGIGERDLHAAVSGYASSEWHRSEKRWTTIQRFFTGDLVEKYIDESPELRRERDHANNQAAEEANERRLAQDRERQRREVAERTKQRRAAQEAKAAASAKASKEPKSISQAILCLPEGDRWVLPTLISKKADEKTRARAKKRADDVLVKVWRYLPERVRSQIDVKVQLEVNRTTGRLVPVSDLTLDQRRTLRLPQLLKLMQSPTNFSAPSMGEVLSMKGVLP